MLFSSFTVLYFIDFLIKIKKYLSKEPCQNNFSSWRCLLNMVNNAGHFLSYRNTNKNKQVFNSKLVSFTSN